MLSGSFVPASVVDHLKLWKLASIAVAIFLINSTANCAAAPITIAAQGKSTYSIVTPPIPPVSVKNAAEELRLCIKEATGADLPIRKDNEVVAGPFISLGSTQQAKQAGISVEKIPDDGFRIVSRNNNLYIIGFDTTSESLAWNEKTLDTMKLHPEIPGPAFTKNGGLSNGTANGVYTFLENQLGVRWLFPGELGRDVPKKSTFAIEAMDHSEAPRFNIRFLALIRNMFEWQAQQKLGYSYRAHFTHNWEDTVPAELYKEHPNWFAADSTGKRPKPPERVYKIETTNPEVVRYFADRAIATLKADPSKTSYALSPSDGLGWSQSPESKALYDPAPPGAIRPSVTPLVLKFYRDVAAIVEKEYPQGKVGGFIYQDFSYPPQQGSMELPKNFIPTIVGKSMGFTFYRPSTRELEASLLEQWSKVVPENWYYYGMPTWLREASAMVTPAAVNEINFLYSTMVKTGIDGAFIYGTPVWSQGALVNYVNAKMLWNPTGDAREVQRDFLTRAYGPKAGAVMERLYNKLDESWWSDFFRSPRSTHYNVSEAMFRNTFGAYYPEMEKLFLEADAQPMTEKQKQRLDLIKQNMIALQFRLRNAGYLPAEYSSPLTRNPAEVFALFTDKETKNNFSYVMVPHSGGQIAATKLEIGAPPALQLSAQTKAPAIPNSRHVLLYPTRDGEIRLKPIDVKSGSNFITYFIQDAKSNSVAKAFLTEGEDIVFQAKANTPYYLKVHYEGVHHRPQVKWDISIPGAVLAKASFQNDTLYLQTAAATAANTAPLYVYVPAETKLESRADDAGVSIRTEGDAVVNTRVARETASAAKKAVIAAQERYQADVMHNLDAKWQFTTDPEKSGEQNGFFKKEFNDTAWKSVGAIGPWQTHGFPDYHGTAWYRKVVTIPFTEIDPLALGGKSILLFFGAVDGDAEFWVNGEKVGQHIMSSHSNGWEVPVALDVTPALVEGKNTIAVKVTKNSHVGGLYRGASLLMGVLPKN